MVGLHHGDTRRDPRIGTNHPCRRHHRSIGRSRRRFSHLGGICHINHRRFDDGIAGLEDRPLRWRTPHHLRGYHQLHRSFDHCPRRRRARYGRQPDRHIRVLLLRRGNVASFAAPSRYANRCRHRVDADRSDHSSFRCRSDQIGPRKCTLIRWGDSRSNHRVALSRASSARTEPMATLVDIVGNNRWLHSGCVARNI